MPLAPPKLVGFSHWDTEYFHKQQQQLGHNASGRAGPPSAVGGFPPFPVFFSTFRVWDGFLPQSCCPAPSSIQAEVSPQPPSLAPSPAHSQGHRAHFEGVYHQYHFPRLDFQPFHCLGPARPPLPPGGPETAAVGSPVFPRSALYPQRPPKASFTNTTAGPRPTLTRFLGQSASAGRPTTAG